MAGSCKVIHFEGTKLQCLHNLIMGPVPTSLLFPFNYIKKIQINCTHKKFVFQENTARIRFCWSFFLPFSDQLLTSVGAPCGHLEESKTTFKTGVPSGFEVLWFHFALEISEWVYILKVSWKWCLYMRMLMGLFCPCLCAGLMLYIFPPFRLFLHQLINQAYLYRWKSREEKLNGRICANGLDFSILCLHSGLISKPHS